MSAGAAPTPGERGEVIDALTALGMAAVDAEVYLKLSTAGPQKAGPLAKLMGWSRPETYRILQRLVENEIVEAALARPVEFRAVPIATLFERLQRVQHDRLARIRDTRAAVEGRLERLQKRTPAAQSEAGLTVFHDRPHALAAVDRMATEARMSLRIVATAPDLLRALRSSGILLKAEQRRADGLDVRLLVAPPEPPPEGARAAPDAPPGCIVLADEREALFWMAVAATPRIRAEGEVAIWTDAAPFVAMQAALLDALWDRSGDAEWR